MLLLALLSECLDNAEFMLKVLSDSLDMFMLLLPSIESLNTKGCFKVCFPSMDEAFETYDSIVVSFFWLLLF